jgi:hypothetical protein
MSAFDWNAGAETITTNSDAVLKSGSTMSGQLDLGGNAISGVGTISAVTVVGTLTTPAQVGITSLGTLSSLTLGGEIAMGNNKITGCTDPTSAQDVCTKAYADLAPSTWSGLANSNLDMANYSISNLDDLTVNGELNIDSATSVLKAQYITSDTGLELASLGTGNTNIKGTFSSTIMSINENSVSFPNGCNLSMPICMINNSSAFFSTPGTTFPGVLCPWQSITGNTRGFTLASPYTTFTVTESGLYEVSATIGFDYVAGKTGFRHVYFETSNTTDYSVGAMLGRSSVNGVINEATTLHSNFMIKFRAGSTLKCYVMQDTNVNLTCGASGRNYISIKKIGVLF